MNKSIQTNKEWWNKVTPIHAKSRLYGLENFKKGKSSLNTIEKDELENVKNKSMLHLQCHFGMETISWAREGAITTGVDISDESITLAKSLSKELKVPARFICADIYNLPNVLDEQFDIVFTSYGVLAWLPDLKQWAKVVNTFLKKGGTFFIAEIHPFTAIFDKKLNIAEGYFTNDPYTTDVAHDYADDQVVIENKVHMWNHTMSEVITSLTQEGLNIEYVHEFPFTVYNQFPGLLQEDKQGYWRFKNKKLQLPLLFSLKAIK